MADLKYRPIIGVSGPDQGGFVAWIFTSLAVLMSGGKAIRITPARPISIGRLDGLILGGGADIDPGLYGAEEKKSSSLNYKTAKPLWRRFIDLIFFPLLLVIRKLLSTKQYHSPDVKRDELEKKLIAEAIERQLPILGICRGAQLLNIHHGGTLYQDLHEFYQEVPKITTILPKKEIAISSESMLARIIKKNKSRVNALHRQAIKKLGHGLTVVATEKSGVIQAIERQSYSFLLGVQWHPEYLPQHQSQRAIFKALITEAYSEKQT